MASPEFVWGDRDDARRFITASRPALKGRAPLDAAMTELGAREVEELLDKIFHGPSA